MGYYYLHFKDVETEAQGGQLTFSGSKSKEVLKLGLTPMQSNS